MFWRKDSDNPSKTGENSSDEGEKRGYLTTRPEPLKSIKKNQGTDLALPKDLKKLTPQQISYIMAKIKSGDFKRYERNQKGHSLLHIFTGLGISKLVKTFLEMIQSDPNVLNTLDNNGNSALDYATVREIEKLIQQHGGRKATAILEQYSREAMALAKSRGGDYTQSGDNRTRQRE